LAGNQTHQRVNDILLGPLERPLLHWLAAHMPAWMTPDKLTIIGVAGALLIFAGYWASQLSAGYLFLVALGLVINWLGDSLDGTLARYRHIERPRYGYFVDHSVDSFNEFMIMFGMGLSPYVRLDIALLALCGYLLMSILVFLRTQASGVFKISYGRFGPTEVRVILLILTMIMFLAGPVRLPAVSRTLTLYDLLVGAVAVVLIALYLANTLRQARQLAQTERSP
jgi:phosphatidylglycerophosphate synthase